MSDWAGTGEDATLITMAQHFSVIFTSLCDRGVRPQGLRRRANGKGGPSDRGSQGRGRQSWGDEGSDVVYVRASYVRRVYLLPGGLGPQSPRHRQPASAPLHVNVLPSFGSQIHRESQALYVKCFWYSLTVLVPLFKNKIQKSLLTQTFKNT